VSLVTALLAAAVCNVNWVLLCSSFLSIWREVSEWQEHTRDCSPHRYPKTDVAKRWCLVESGGLSLVASW